MMHLKKSMLIVTLIVLFLHILFAVAYFQPTNWLSIAQAAYQVGPSNALLPDQIVLDSASVIDNSPQIFDTPEMLDMLVEESDLIVRGRVIAQASRWNSDKSDVETHTVIEPLYTIAGEAPNTLVIHTRGGELADEGFATHDPKAASFEMDQEVLVFAYVEGSHYRVARDERGKFLVGKSIAVNEAQHTYTALHMLYSELKFYLLNLNRTVTLPYDWDEIEPDTEEILLGQGFHYNERNWEIKEVKFKVNINTSQAGEDDGSVQDFLDTVIRAAETWSRVNTSNFILTYDGPTDNTETGINGSNDIVFEHRGTEEAVAKARYWFNPKTGIIQEADIWINDDFQWNATGDPEEFELDLQTAVLHEMGHWLALGHDTAENSIMYFSLPGGLAKRGLHSNDKEGISFIYPCLQGDCIPAGLAPEATSSPTPTVQSTATRRPTSSPTPTVRSTATRRPTSSPTPTVRSTATTRPTASPTPTTITQVETSESVVATIEPTATPTLRLVHQKLTTTPEPDESATSIPVATAIPTSRARPSYATEVDPDTGATLSGVLDDLVIDIDFPAGATEETVELSLEYVDVQELYEVDILGVAFDITTKDGAGNPITQFDPPLKLQLAYGDLISAGEPEAIKQKGIHLAYWNPEFKMWIVVPSQIDYENQQIVAELDHLTIFAIMDGYPYYSFLPIIVE